MTVEFSIAGYRELLDRLSSRGYQTIAFSELHSCDRSSPVCLLRHDVDASTGFAVRLAELEAERAVRSTYFVMVRSTLYNAFSRQAYDDIRRILQLGHEVGLHFDASHPEARQSASIEQQIAEEMRWLSGTTGRPVTAFSFHQPARELLARQITVSGAVNAYAIGDEFHYVSDSNRDWRGQDVVALIESGKPLQMLLHPMWWICQDPHVWDCWDAAILENMSRQQEWLRATEGAFGPLRQLRLTRDEAPIQQPGAAAEAAYLAPLTDADSAQLFEWINDRELVVLSAPYRPVHQPDHDAWFRAIRARKDVAIFGIRRTADHHLVGSCQLHSIDPEKGTAELQIRIGVASARGKGIGPAACRALLRYAFDDLNLRRVHLHVLDTNAAAKRLYEKIGFTADGVTRNAVYIDGASRDLVTMSITRPTASL
jgi:RimJ/RimL family protein N-acetyltransferase